MLIRKALGTVVFALEKRLAGKSRRVLNVGTRSTTAGNKTFLGDLFNSSFDGDFGNAIELAELNDGGKLVARFKSAILNTPTNICSYRLVFGNHGTSFPTYMKTKVSITLNRVPILLLSKKFEKEKRKRRFTFRIRALKFKQRTESCSRPGLTVWGRFCFGRLDIGMTGARPRRITCQSKPVSNRKL